MWSKNKKAFLALSFIIGIVFIGFWTLFNKNGYKEYSSSESFGTLVDLLVKASSGEETIKIDEQKINSLGASYFKQGFQVDKINIGGLNVHMWEDNINILIPVKYKAIPLVLSTKGKLQVNEETLVFFPEYFKVGKLSVSKNKVFSLIKKSFTNKIEIGENSLEIDTKFVSSKIQILALKDGNFIAKVNDSTRTTLSKVDKAVKAIEMKDEEIANAGDSKSSSAGEKREVTSKNKSSSNSKGLSSKESQMISIMNNTIDTLDSNPSYNYWPNVNRVMAIYETLSPEEKASFKKKVYSYVDVARAKRVKSKIK